MAVLAALAAVAFAIVLIWKGRVAAGEKEAHPALQWKEAGESDLF
jgi:hypothetical protein